MEPKVELELDLVQSQMHEHFGDSPDHNGSQNVDQRRCHQQHGEDYGIQELLKVALRLSALGEDRGVQF
jgi:hypothetical protein